MEVTDVWKVLDISRSSLPKGFTDFLEEYVQYRDLILNEDLYGGGDLFEEDHKDVSTDFRLTIIEIQKAMKEYDCFYFRIV